ncbi:heavy metal RND efflux outer membrane protein [Buttiauxella noackiae ATCC 51607]|uniref:Heavy metal RND efflux outer membrane protein n=1 Tax=Buttiauxella noackiae ATCC 51607 TaxID=1354255 RepID=A0A1B7HZK3_9ENTR|nr:TolC family protein [Buttiauxella noackiae]OAT21140.1 heavy metal RND efflux outer membrane protein [Buttiauxella noackiae ATCC 51607]
MRQHSLSLWLGGVLFAVSVSAANAAEFSLQQTLNAAENYSAELSANRNQSDALNAMADSARELPDPKLKFGIENVPVQGSNSHRFTREGMTMQRIGIMQEYVSEDKRDRKAETILAQSASSAAKAEVIRTTLQRTTAQAWLDLALSQKVLATAQKLVDETERQVDVQKATVASGSSPASSVVDIRMTLLGMQDKVTLAQRDVVLAQTRLLQLTGEQIDNTSGTLPRYQRLPADPAVLEQNVGQHPEVIEAAREADVAKARSAQSAVAAKPNVGVEVFYAHRADDYDDMAGVMFTVDLPMFKSQRQDKDLAADMSRTMEANDQLALSNRERIALVRTLVAQYQAAQTLWLRQQDEILPLQRQRLSLVEAQYRSGQSTLSDLLNARRTLLDTELAAHSAEKNVAETWAAIRYLTPQENNQ